MNSYLKFLSRHRLFTIINIVGLCLSMAFLLLLGDLIYRQTLTVVIQSVVAMVIAIPLSCWLAPMVSSISGLTIKMEFIPLLLSLVIVLAVNLLTAAFQGWHAATENPIESIKTE